MESATCIAAVVLDGQVFMGGDTLAVDRAGSQNRLTNPKVFSLKDKSERTWLFGFSGFYRFAQLLEYKLELPEFPKDNNYETVLPFLVKEFIPALQTCLKDNFFEQTEKGRAFGGTFLLGFCGRLFIIGDGYSIQESVLPYNATGCGAQTALGSLFSTNSLLPQDRIRIALEAAAEFNSGVGGVPTILHS